MRPGERSRANRDGTPEISIETARRLWAGRVPQTKIIQLYETDAMEIEDDNTATDS